MDGHGSWAGGHGQASESISKKRCKSPDRLVHKPVPVEPASV